MDRNQLLTMDPVILLSFINTKLRDEFDDLSAFCEDVNIDSSEIEERLKKIDYIYHHELNQFIRK